MIEFTPFRVHLMLVQILDRHWPESSESHMQCQFGLSDSSIVTLFQQLRGEMQSRRGGCDRARVSRKNSLIPFLIVRVSRLAIEVRRQWERSKLMQQLNRATLLFGREDKNAIRFARDKFQLKLVSVGGTNRDRLSDLQVTTRLADQLPLAVFVTPQVQAFPLAAGRDPMPQQACRQDLSVVQHEAVVRREQFRQVSNRFVRDLLCLSGNHQQSRGIPRRKRDLGNQGFRQGIVVSGKSVEVLHVLPVKVDEKESVFARDRTKDRGRSKPAEPHLHLRPLPDDIRMCAASQPVPIAFCITELDRGGAERALSRLVLGLDRQRWSPHVYCLGPRGHYVDVLEVAGIPVHCLNGRGLWSLPRIVCQLTMAFRRLRPALLQTFLFHGNLIGRIAARLASIPVVVSGIRVAERRSRWYGRLDRWTNGLVDHNVCVSQGVAEFSIQETGLKSGKISVIPNGVDYELFSQAVPADLSEIGLAADRPVVITVARLEEQKGISDLLQAAVRVVHDRPDCQFLIVGDGRDRIALEAQAASLGIADAIHFTGARGDVPALLKASSVFVLPSLWEGMPNALLEAMAAGLPVVATAVEGSREIVRSNETGLLVEPRNPAMLSEAILRLLRDPDFSDKIASQSQHIVRKSFTEQSVVAAYCDLYERIMRSLHIFAPNRAS